MKDVLIDIISERKSSGPFSREILGKTLLTRGGARVELRAHTRGFALEKGDKVACPRRHCEKLVNHETVLRIWVSGPLLRGEY